MGKKTKASKAKNAAKKTAAMSALIQSLVTTCGTAGFATANAFQDTVIAVRGIVKETRPGSARNRALDAAAAQFKGGYVARSLLGDPAYVKRWHNLTIPQQIDEGAAIIAKAAPTTTKDDRRTEAEHKVCRAADASWFKVKQNAGLTEPKKNKGNRKPRQTKGEAKAPPVDLVKASPTFNAAFAKSVGAATPKAAANDYFGTAAAALLATVDKNAKLVDPRISTAVSDFLTAVKAALGIVAE